MINPYILPNINLRSSDGLTSVGELTYSVAIRTLALAPEHLRRTLESVFRQTIKPLRVVIYIAHGYRMPDFRIGYEEYVYVDKGMVSQRSVDYDDIASDLMLLLDDDVEMSTDSVRLLIDGLKSKCLDCIAADTFPSHKLSLSQRIYAAVTGLTLPHYDNRFAYKIRWSGAFSYLRFPKEDVCLSQSAAGPCALWRREALVALHIDDERWLDSLGFAYNDDQLIFYKLYANGGRLGVHYACGVTHIDGASASGAFKKSYQRYYIRAQSWRLIWHRTIYEPEKSPIRRKLKAGAFLLRVLCTLPAHIIYFPALFYHIKGLLVADKHV